MSNKLTTAGALVLIVLGIAALIYGGITYTSRETILDIGPLQATAVEQKTFPLPPVLGIAAVIGGLVLLATRRSRAA
jgi:hypothetical protein